MGNNIAKTPINIEYPDEPIMEFQKAGYYFRPSTDPNTLYLVMLDVKDERHTEASISELSLSWEEVGRRAKNGDLIATMDTWGEPVAIVDVWQKYYFVTIEPKKQLYHSDNDGYPQDTLRGLSDAVNFAVAKVLEVTGMETY